jgi:hypothetical protein
MALTFTQLTEAIEQHQATSIEEVLALKEIPEDLKQNYTLLFNSKSTQRSSLENPRAILFGNDAKLILTFNGDPKHNGYKTLEISEFNDQLDRFELHQIDFSQAKPKISEMNPKKCLVCHTAEVKPIWSNYPYWPGAFGGNDDDLKLINDNDIEFLMKATGKTDRRAMRGEGMVPLYEEFLEKRRSHPRYSQLMGKEGFPHWPWGNKAPRSVRTLELLPNTRLSALLFAYNQKRIYRKSKDSPEYETHKHLLVYAALECPIDEDLYNALKNNGFVKNEPLTDLQNWWPRGLFYKSLQNKLLGFDVGKELSMNLNGGPPDEYNDGFIENQMRLNYLWYSDLAEAEPDLKAHLAKNEYVTKSVLAADSIAPAIDEKKTAPACEHIKPMAILELQQTTAGSTSKRALKSKAKEVRSQR